MGGLIRILKRTIGVLPVRSKPSFIIIGAQKAGTSALFQMLAKHPDIVAPGTKEVHFFEDDAAYAKGIGHYLSHFPGIDPARKGSITFEATPAYLFHAEKVAPRIKKHLPEVTCIAILRDPVKRAYSAWNMFRDFKGHPKYAALHDPRTFQQAVEDELAGRTRHVHHLYLARGRYSEQLPHFKALFPERRLLVRAYPDLVKDAGRFVAGLCTALGLSEMPDALALNTVRDNARPYSDGLDPALAKELYQYFTPELKQLRNVLGYDPDIMEDHG